MYPQLNFSSCCPPPPPHPPPFTSSPSSQSLFPMYVPSTQIFLLLPPPPPPPTPPHHHHHHHSGLMNIKGGGASLFVVCLFYMEGETEGGSQVHTSGISRGVFSVLQDSHVQLIEQLIEQLSTLVAPIQQK